MAIQFPCENCEKPLEVDDDQAGQPAMCPYCGATVRVPAESTLPAPPAPDMRPIETSPSPTTPVPEAVGIPSFAPSGPAGRPPARNRLGNWGLALGLVAWVFFALGAFYLLTKAAGFLFAQGDEQPSPQELQEEMRRLAEEPQFAKTLALLNGVYMLAAPAGFILSLLAVRKKDLRKGTAIAGLILSGTLLLCLILSGLFGASLASGGG